MSQFKKEIKKTYTNALNQRLQTQLSEQSSCCSPSSTSDESNDLTQTDCCPPTATETKKQSTIPSFGCVINLAQKANIQKGDIVIDLGSGAGHDLFQAADFVGPNGRAIGIDFTHDMIIAGMKTAMEKGYTNVDFRLSDIEEINILPDNFADVIISNCVINLTMDKGAVFKEAFRILKPGGRLVDADIIAANQLPSEITQDPETWCSCLGGALTEEGYSEKIKEAGFEGIKVTIFSDFKYLNNQFHSGIIEAQKPLSD
ncbi:MAG: methyltransferase domain-containing protein [Candidatus Heimdallarchaeota archaeon]|nr:MAG: methyltransferase domain-containing protein [Candidatus Heimdallarchaeota archaeon]